MPRECLVDAKSLFFIASPQPTVQEKSFVEDEEFSFLALPHQLDFYSSRLFREPSCSVLIFKEEKQLVSSAYFVHIYRLGINVQAHTLYIYTALELMCSVQRSDDGIQ